MLSRTVSHRVSNRYEPYQLALATNKKIQKEFSQFSVSAPFDNVWMVCYIEDEDLGPFHSRFVLRLKQRHKDNRCISFVSLSMKGFRYLMEEELTIRELLYARVEAEIFQDGDLQVYVEKGYDTEHYLLHFDDVETNRSVSMNAIQLVTIVSYEKRVYQQFEKFESSRNFQLMKLGETMGLPVVPLDLRKKGMFVYRRRSCPPKEIDREKSGKDMTVLVNSMEKQLDAYGALDLTKKTEIIVEEARNSNEIDDDDDEGRLVICE